MLIKPLPHWVLVEKFPAFNDFESLTAIEQTARVYGKINELIENYNKYVSEINKVIEEMSTAKDTDIQAFICRITILTNNYINTVDMKIMHQDRQIAEVYEKFSTDVINTVKLLISDMHTAGTLDTAILTALDNIKNKVDNFTADCEQFKRDMSADYSEVKKGLSEDYAAKKAALDTDYSEVKNGLSEDYETTKAALETDYSEVKTGLSEDYAAKKTALEIDYSNTKSGLTRMVEKYTEMAENKGKVLWTGSLVETDPNYFGMLDNPENFGEFVASAPLTVEGISKYTLLLIDGILCVNRGTYIEGSKTLVNNNATNDTVLYPSIDCVSLKLSGDTIEWITPPTGADSPNNTCSRCVYFWYTDEDGQPTSIPNYQYCIESIIGII